MTNDNEREVTSASQPVDGEPVPTEIVGGQENPEVSPKVEAALAEAADKGELDGGPAPLAVQEAEVEHADEAYNLDVPGAGVVEKTVQEDLEARQELAAEPHREVENDDLADLAIGDAPETFVPTVFVNSIRPDEKVQVVVRERTDSDPSDFGVESTEQERIVKDLAESGQLFDKGGPLVNWTGDTDDLSDGVDGLFLAERSKQIGAKLF
jgi:hypothetical protein